jgi:hypothetical protein
VVDEYELLEVDEMVVFEPVRGVTDPVVKLKVIGKVLGFIKYTSIEEFLR